MSAIPSSEQRMAAFRSACKRAVAKRNGEGMMPSRSSIPLVYRDLTDTEKAEARTWLAQTQHAAIARCDLSASRAWGIIRDRVKNYDIADREKAGQ